MKKKEIALSGMALAVVTRSFFRLAAAGGSGFNIAKTANSVTLAYGNQVADLGTYTRTDGIAGTLGETSQLADVNLAQDTFQSVFTYSKRGQHAA